MPFLATAKYGKDKVRVMRVMKQPDGLHRIVEYNVCVLLEGEIDAAFTESDNSNIVATDSIKNTIYYLAKTSDKVMQPEAFALLLASHFLKTYPHIHGAHVDIVSLKWSPIPVNAVPSKHSFVRDGEDKRITSVVMNDQNGKDKLEATIKSGIQDLLVLKTTESSFENFLRDKYTTLPEVDDRIFSTMVDCSYTLELPSTVLNSPLTSTLESWLHHLEPVYVSVLATTLEIFATHNSASVQATLYLMATKVLKDNPNYVRDVTYRLPNKHYFAVDMKYIGIDNTQPADAEVFMPVDAPSGLIVATVSRD